MNITNRFANVCYLDLYTLYQQMIITHSEIQATATKGRFFFYFQCHNLLKSAYCIPGELLEDERAYIRDHRPVEQF